MKIKLTFPANKSRYYYGYCCSIKSAFEVAGAEVVIDPSLTYLCPGVFYFKINDKLVLADFSDYNDEYNWGYNIHGFFRKNKMYIPENLNVPIFKRTMTVGNTYSNNTFPLGPYYVENNKNCKDLAFLHSIGNIYDPIKGDGIFHSNRVYAQNTMTRGLAKKKINHKKLLPEVKFITSRVDQYTFWKNHSKCISSLNISGASYYAQDKNPIEAMFLGVCIISNNFDMYLPCDEKLDHTQHYICISEGYDDINEKINYVYENRAECKDIGTNAYDLMNRSCAPKPKVKWMAEIVENYYS